MVNKKEGKRFDIDSLGKTLGIDVGTGVIPREIEEVLAEADLLHKIDTMVLQEEVDRGSIIGTGVKMVAGKLREKQTDN
jgi:hypothetical protein